MENKKKLILDVDTGIDDALAIAYALTSDVDLIGVCTIFGNSDLATTSLNTLNLLDYLGRSDIKVYSGSRYPMDTDSYIVRKGLYKVHGRNGVGNVELPNSTRVVEDEYAWEYLVRCAKQYGEELIIVCLGPLTNLAKAYQLDAEVMKSVGNITVMGGALTIGGNVTNYAEANFYNDPLAGKKVMESDLKLNVVGLDVTLQTLITKKDLVKWQDGPIKQMTEYYYHFEDDEVIGGALHDPLAVEAALNPSIITNWFTTNLTIETEGEFKGKLAGNKQLLNLPTKHINYALAVDSEAFIEKFINQLK